MRPIRTIERAVVSRIAHTAESTAIRAQTFRPGTRMPAVERCICGPSATEIVRAAV
jgi:hypothetical protein